MPITTIKRARRLAIAAQEEAASRYHWSKASSTGKHIPRHAVEDQAYVANGYAMARIALYELHQLEAPTASTN